MPRPFEEAAWFYAEYRYRPSEVFARPGFAERVTAAAAARGDARLPGPGRAELLEIVSSAGVAA